MTVSASLGLYDYCENILQDLKQDNDHSTFQTLASCLLPTQTAAFEDVSALVKYVHLAHVYKENYAEISSE